MSWLVPIAIFFGFWVFMMRRFQQQSGFMTIGKNKAKIYVDDEVSVRFDDAAGVDEAKQELEEVINFLKEPQRYTRVGGQIPRGTLLVGPPGTGKTLLAKAVAGESGVPFFSLSGSEFVEMFVGLGAARVRDLFKQAKEKAPCIILIDEEVRRIIDEQYDVALRILAANRELLVITVGQLLKDEVIDGDSLIELAEAVTPTKITDDSPEPESTEQEMAA